MQSIVNLLKEKCCVFIGAGIPKALGFPLWNELANELVSLVWEKRDAFEEKKLSFSIKEELEGLIKNGKPITAVTYCRDLLKGAGLERDYQTRIVSCLHNETKYGSAKDNLVYMQLKRLFKDTLIVQTNLDKSIQQYCRFPSYINTNLPNPVSTPSLVYLHGVITDPNSWVMARDEYDNFYQRNSNFMSFVQNVFQNFNVLFLGYSLNDKEILDQIAKVKGSGRQYILVLEEIEKNKALNVVFENELQHYEIAVVRYNVERDGYAAFGAFLKEVNSLLTPHVQLAMPANDGSRINE